MNQETIGAMTNLILASVSEERMGIDGAVTNTVDNEMLFYRLLDVDSDNFSAFILEAKNCLTWANTIHEHVTPYVAVSLQREMREIIRNYLISITGKSGEKGKLIRLLLQDRSESIVTFKGDNKNMLDKLRNSQGDNQQQQQGGQQ